MIYRNYNFSLYIRQALFIVALVVLEHSYPNLMQSVILLNLFEKISFKKSFKS
jgi:hypothetical protein